MNIKIYETVPHRETVLRAVLFGLNWITLKPSELVDIEKIDIRVYSLGHPTSKGTSTLIKNRATVSVFTCRCSCMDDIYTTIFHELVHLKQFCTRPMNRVEGHGITPSDPDEMEAEDESMVMLEAFKQQEEKRALQS